MYLFDLIFLGDQDCANTVAGGGCRPGFVDSCELVVFREHGVPVFGGEQRREVAFLEELGQDGGEEWSE